MTYIGEARLFPPPLFAQMNNHQNKTVLHQSRIIAWKSMDDFSLVGNGRIIFNDTYKNVNCKWRELNYRGPRMVR